MLWSKSAPTVRLSKSVGRLTFTMLWPESQPRSPHFQWIGGGMHVAWRLWRANRPQRLSRCSGARQRRRGRCTSSANVSGGPWGSNRLFRRGPTRSNHAAPTSNGLVEACTWPSAYGVPTGPSTSHFKDGARQRPVAGAPAAPVTVEGRGTRAGFSAAARQGPTTQPPLPSDWWRHARGHLWLGLHVLV